MRYEITIALISALVGVLGAFATIFIHRSVSRISRARLGAEITSLSEINKRRIEVYEGLWRLLGSASTFNMLEDPAHLKDIQLKLQAWYYDQTGGLFIDGSSDEPASTKAAFFAARDLSSEDPAAVWHAFHRLRHCLRRDIGIFDDPKEEAKRAEITRAKLGKLGA